MTPAVLRQAALRNRHLCGFCGGALPAGEEAAATGRPRRYCRDACRQANYRRRRRVYVALMRQHGMGEYVPLLWLDYRTAFPNGRR